MNLTFILSISEHIWTKSPTAKWCPLSNPPTPLGDKLFPASDNPTGPDTFVNTAGLNVHLKRNTILSLQVLQQNKHRCKSNYSKIIPISWSIRHDNIVIFINPHNCASLAEAFKHAVRPATMTCNIRCRIIPVLSNNLYRDQFILKIVMNLGLIWLKVVTMLQVLYNF